MVSGEYNVLKEEMPLFPPQGFSHTSHPQDQTPPAYGSHILMNAGGKERCRKAHTGLAQNGPYRLSLRPQSFIKTKGGISFIFSKPSIQGLSGNI